MPPGTRDSNQSPDRAREIVLPGCRVLVVSFLYYGFAVLAMIPSSEAGIDAQFINFTVGLVMVVMGLAWQFRHRLPLLGSPRAPRVFAGWVILLVAVYALAMALLQYGDAKVRTIVNETSSELDSFQLALENEDCAGAMNAYARAFELANTVDALPEDVSKQLLSREKERQACTILLGLRRELNSPNVQTGDVLVRYLTFYSNAANRMSIPFVYHQAQSDVRASLSNLDSSGLITTALCGSWDEFVSIGLVENDTTLVAGVLLRCADNLRDSGNLLAAEEIYDTIQQRFGDAPESTESFVRRTEMADELATLGGREGAAVIRRAAERACVDEDITYPSVGRSKTSSPKTWIHFSSQTTQIENPPSERRAQSPGEFKLAVCVDVENTPVQTCSYCPKGFSDCFVKTYVRRSREDWLIRVVEAQSHRQVAQMRLVGDTPEACPEETSYDHELIGKPSYDELEVWLDDVLSEWHDPLQD